MLNHFRGSNDSFFIVRQPVNVMTRMTPSIASLHSPPF